MDCAGIIISPQDAAGGIVLSAAKGYNSASSHSTVPVVLPVVTSTVSDIASAEANIRLIQDQLTKANAEKAKLQSELLEASKALPVHTDMSTSTKQSESSAESNSPSEIRLPVEGEENTLSAQPSVNLEKSHVQEAGVIAFCHGALCVVTPIALVVILDYLYLGAIFLNGLRKQETWAVKLRSDVKSNPRLTAGMTVAVILLTVAVGRYSFMIYTMAICIGSCFLKYKKITLANFQEHWKICSEYCAQSFPAFSINKTCSSMRFTEIPTEDPVVFKHAEQLSDDEVERKVAEIHAKHAEIIKRYV